MCSHHQETFATTQTLNEYDEVNVIHTSVLVSCRKAFRPYRVTAAGDPWYALDVLQDQIAPGQ